MSTNYDYESYIKSHLDDGSFVENKELKAAVYNKMSEYNGRLVQMKTPVGDKISNLFKGLIGEKVDSSEALDHKFRMKNDSKYKEAFEKASAEVINELNAKLTTQENEASQNRKTELSEVCKGLKNITEDQAQVKYDNEYNQSIEKFASGSFVREDMKRDFFNALSSESYSKFIAKVGRQGYFEGPHEFEKRQIQAFRDLTKNDIDFENDYNKSAHEAAHQLALKAVNNMDRERSSNIHSSSTEPQGKWSDTDYQSQN